MTTRWAWLIGQPVAQSLSPALHNAAFAAAGLDAHYSVHETAVDDLTQTIAALRSPDCLGANVTAPHKRAVLSMLDSLSDAAVALGAVNTIVSDGGRLLGDNTDAGGLARWMRDSGIDVHGQAGLVLGAGGAARASVWALAHRGAASVDVLNRTVERAQELVDSLQSHLPRVRLTGGRLEQAAEQRASPYAIVINSTSLGHHAGTPRVHPSCYSPESVALELVYNPPETGFMRAAQNARAGRVENGLGMLVHQAALAFECWTGRPAPLEAYERAAREGV